MPCYIISYDLSADDGKRDYGPLIATIKEYGTWARITASTWAVVTDETPTQITDRLLVHLEDSDRLLVVRSGVESAWYNARCRDTWLKKHL